MPDVLSNIQKLLALSGNNPNENEARSALAMAERLMLEHNISMSDVEAFDECNDPNECPFDIGDTILSGSQVLPHDVRPIIWLCTRYFFVECIVKKTFVGSKVKQQQVKFFGTKENIATASFVFKYLHHVFRDLYSKFKKQYVGSGTSYYWGLAKGFSETLKAERKRVDSNALMVIQNQLVKAFEARIDCKSRAPRKVKIDSTSYHQGIKDGRKISIRPALAAQEKRKELA